MILIAIVLFAIAAAVGATLAVLRLKNRTLPMPLILTHGLVAATALALVLVATLMGGGTTLQNIALGLFVVAALGGFALFSFQLRRTDIPLPLMFIHAAVAVAAYVLLLLTGFHLA